MKYFLFCFWVLTSLTAVAKVPISVTESYSAFRMNPADQKKLSDICAQLKTDHLEDIELLHKLQADFKELVTHQDKILNLNARSQLLFEIKKVTERIIAASDSSWNKEVIPSQIMWRLPRELFFDETEYKAVSQRLAEYGDLASNSGKIKDLILHINPHFPVDLISFKNSKIKNSDFIKNATNPNEFSEIHVLQSYYAGKPNEDIQQYFHLPWSRDDKTGLELIFEKPVTALEFCQILPKTKFLIQVDYVFEAFGLTFDANQDFFLEIKMENL